MEKTFTFEHLPENVNELQALPEAALNDAFATAALAVLALCEYEKSPDDCFEMLNFLKGPAELSTYDKQFIKDRLSDKKYLPRSYFNGSTPENGYTVPAPYGITVFDNPYSYQNEGYATLHINSGGADSPRQVTLRRKGEQWFVWEILLYSGIRVPADEDPWA